MKNREFSVTSRKIMRFSSHTSKTAVMKLSILFKPNQNLLNTDHQTNLQETYDWLTTCFHQFENQKKYYILNYLAHVIEQPNVQIPNPQSHYLQLKLLSGKNACTWDSMDFT